MPIWVPRLTKSFLGSCELKSYGHNVNVIQFNKEQVESKFKDSHFFVFS